MALSIRDRFRNLVINLRYSQIRIATHHFPVSRLVSWMQRHMQPIVEQLETEWDMSDERTWMENVFISHVIAWHDKKIAIFITNSYQDYRLSRTFYESRVSESFWREFGLHAHISVLVDSHIFIEPEGLDDIYAAIDWDKKYSLLDMSGYDDEENLLPHLKERWGFLESLLEDDGTYQEWSDIAKLQLRDAS